MKCHATAAILVAEMDSWIFSIEDCYTPACKHHQEFELEIASGVRRVCIGYVVVT